MSKSERKIRDFAIHSVFIGWKVHINYFLMTHIISVFYVHVGHCRFTSFLDVGDETSDFMVFSLLDAVQHDEKNQIIGGKSYSFPFFSKE